MKADHVVTTMCASHCGGACLLKLHVNDGVITRIETDDGEEQPQLRACLRGRAYRQRVYAPDRMLYPLRRIGERGEGKFERISWDEALDTVARELVRVRDRYGSQSILRVGMIGEVTNINNGSSPMSALLSALGGNTSTWGITSFQAGINGQLWTYGTFSTANNRDDLVNSRFILMWGWNPAVSITGTTSAYQLIKAREAGTRIVAVDPRCTESAAALADEWIPIRPSTDGAALLGMAYVMMVENLHDQHFLDTYTIGYEKFRGYVLGDEDGVAKNPAWAQAICGVPTETIARLAREYARTKPAALIAGTGPGRTQNGESYHRIASTLAAMTGNIGIHGGDAAGRAWESTYGGYPFKAHFLDALSRYRNPVDSLAPNPPRGSPFAFRANRVHLCAAPYFIEQGKAGGFAADCRLMAVINAGYIGNLPNLNKQVHALRSKHIEFVFVQEQFMTPTVKFADIVLPTNTYFERDDFVCGVGLAYYGRQTEAIESLGESKAPREIAVLLAERLGLSNVVGLNQPYEQVEKQMVADSEIVDYAQFKKEAVYRIPLTEPYVAFKKQIEDSTNNPFPTPSGKIEIYSEQLDELNNPELPAIPRYVEAKEGWNDPLRAKYPLQLLTTHLKRRANTQFDSIPWLRELERQTVMINRVDAEARGIKDGDTVRVLNDRGAIAIPAQVTERIMPGVVDVPFGASYDPDASGLDWGGSANVLVSDIPSAGGQPAYNTALVDVELLSSARAG